jgi:hypothetical protein
VRQIRSFVERVGAGRTLTQTGKIGLADARRLVELLGTGDTIDPKIGDRIFRTTSSTELGHLTRIVEWAKAARLVRVTGSRLVPVKKNAAPPGRPPDLVLALLEAYPRLGKPLCPRGHYRQSLVGDQFSDVSEALVTTKLAHEGPCPLSLLQAVTNDMIADRYMLGGLGELQLDMLRHTNDSDVSIAVAALVTLGVATADGENDTVELTALGRFAIGRIRGLPLPGDAVLQVRIALVGAEDPPVWRRVLIPAAYPLDRVHRRQRCGWLTWRTRASISVTNMTSATAGGTGLLSRRAPRPRPVRPTRPAPGRRRLPARGLRRLLRLSAAQGDPRRPVLRRAPPDADLGGLPGPR